MRNKPTNLNRFKRNRKRNTILVTELDNCLLEINDNIALLDEKDAQIFKKVLSKTSLSKKISQEFLQRLGAYNKKGELLAPYAIEGK